MNQTAPVLSLDVQQARNNMVDGQVRPNRVSDPRVLNAMRTLPRERFAPGDRAAFAYIDEDLPLGNGRVLMEPLVIARLVQMLRIRPADHVLVIGSGPGYGAALASACGGVITALEEDPALLAVARAVLPEVAQRVTVVEGPLLAGWPTGAPYDCILIEGAIREIPAEIGAQLKAGSGRLVTVLHKSGGVPQGVLAEMSGSSGMLRAQPEFDCATPLLPAFRAFGGFVF